jgi:hypothetical protein
MAYRKLIINKQEYQYTIGSHTIVIKHVGGKRYNIQLPELTGLSWEEIEKGHWKNYLQVEPSDVANYIRRKKL